MSPIAYQTIIKKLSSKLIDTSFKTSISILYFLLLEITSNTKDNKYRNNLEIFYAMNDISA